MYETIMHGNVKKVKTNSAACEKMFLCRRGNGITFLIIIPLKGYYGNHA